jgi:hypothetical protein
MAGRRETMSSAYWERRAEIAYRLARRMPNERTRQAMLRVAADYERLAELALANERGAPPHPETEEK